MSEKLLQKMTYTPKSKEWFVERIGKTIYRDADTCSCRVCKDIVENGLIIIDETHADYLNTVDNEYASEGQFLNYRDKK